MVRKEHVRFDGYRLIVFGERSFKHYAREVMHMTNEALWELLLDEPERGLTLLAAQYGGYVRTIVRNKLHGIGTAEDMEETVSDVFVKLWQWAGAHPDARPELRAMLAVIARRQAINRFYALTRQPVSELYDDLLEIPQTSIPSDTGIILMETLRSLGEPDCEILLRRYYFGQSSREIGAALGLQPNTVDQRISRGLKKLRMIWKED